MKLNKLLFVSMWFVLPVFAAEGDPGATTANDGAKPLYGAAQREACKLDPEKCRQERMAQRERKCAQNPEKCKEVKAKLEQRREACKSDPEKCRQEQRARADAHFKKTDADGNGSLSLAEAEKGMPRLVRHFDRIDANQDGQLSREEMAATRKAHQRAKRPGSS